MSKILVLGAAGFTGSSIINYAVQNSRYNIAAIDTFEHDRFTQNLIPAIYAKSRVSVHVAEIENLSILRKIDALEKPEQIIYCALTNTNTIEQELYKLDAALQVFFYHSSATKFALIIKDKYSEAAYFKSIDAHFSKHWKGNWIRQNKQVLIVRACKLFGPKQATTQIAASVCMDAVKAQKPNLDTSTYEFLYIKEFYFRLMAVLEGQTVSGVYDISSGVETSIAEISATYSSISLGGKYSPSVLFNTTQMFEDTQCQYVPTSFGYPPLKLEDYLLHTYVWYNDNYQTHKL